MHRAKRLDQIYQGSSQLALSSHSQLPRQFSGYSQFLLLCSDFDSRGGLGLVSAKFRIPLKSKGLNEPFYLNLSTGIFVTEAFFPSVLVETLINKKC